MLTCDSERIANANGDFRRKNITQSLREEYTYTFAS